MQDDGPIGTTRYMGLEIIGCADFVARTKVAIDLMQQTTYRGIVATHLKRIQSAEQTGAAPWGSPTYEVGRGSEKSSPEVYAAYIVHEAIHCKLYHDNHKRFLFIRFTPFWAWTGTNAEQICMRAQLDALRQLGASEYLQHYLVVCIENPTHHTIPYHKRNW